MPFWGPVPNPPENTNFNKLGSNVFPFSPRIHAYRLKVDSLNEFSFKHDLLKLVE